MAEPWTVHDATTTLRAGGIAPVGATLAGKDKPGPVSARAYAHPVLPDRTVVRLEPDAIAGAADAEMDALGFEAPRVVSGLGKMRHRTVGFPGWAILHDPKHARFALEVTREFKKAAKRAASKPGFAKEDFDAIAARLARSVPHFLPSFWEEVGRVFLEHDSSQFAAQSFERARLAEKEYSLEIDEGARAESFLEFALAGAVSAKSLSAYSKELQSSSGPEAAYDRYRELALRRTLGGLPPWAGLGKELRTLAKAANKDLEEEEDRLIQEILGAPALKGSPGDFWKTYRRALVACGKKGATARKKLLELFPQPGASWRGVSPELAKAHFDLLEECGALAGLVKEPSDPEGIPTEGLAKWVGRAISYLGSCDRSRKILEDLAPQLRALGEPVALVVRSERWYSAIALDLCELALELGIPLAEPANYLRGFLFEGSTCDPVRVAKHPVLGPRLVNAVGETFGTQPFEQIAAGKAGFVEARRLWLQRQIELLETGLLVDAENALDQLEERTTPQTYGEFADLLVRLQAVRVSAILKRTLQAGLVDEFTWPTYEKAVADLGGKVQVEGAFPYMVVRSASQARVIDPAGEGLTHDLALNAAKEEISCSLFLDGQLLVIYRDKTDYHMHGYWSHQPDQRFQVNAYFYGWRAESYLSATLKSGGTTIGQGRIRAGDTSISSPEPFVSDGESVWIPKWEPPKRVLREIDLATGKPGRVSRPTFLEEYIAPDTELLDDECWLAPLPKGVDTSPLGCKAGLVGVRLRKAGDKVLVEGIDGRKMEVPVRTWGKLPQGMLKMPGAEEYVAAIASKGGGNERHALLRTQAGCALCSLEENSWSGAAWLPASVPPVEFWHFVSPRDSAGSAALRRIEEDATRTILDSVADQDHRKPPLALTMPAAVACVRKAIPELKDDRLAAGVAATAEGAWRVGSRIAAIVARGAVAPGERGKELTGPARSLAMLLRALEDPTQSADVPEGSWEEWLRYPKAMALLLLSPATKKEEYSERLPFLEVLAEATILDQLDALRVVQVHGLPPNVREASSGNAVAAWSDGDSNYVALGRWRSFTIVERNLKGTFSLPADLTIQSDERLTGKLPRDWIAKFRKILEGASPPDWDATAPDRVAERTGLTRAEAALLLLGAPNVRNYAKDFLGAELRGVVGLKVAEADAARGLFKTLERSALLSVFEAAFPDDPGSIPETAEALGKALADRVAEAWVAKYGARTKIPEEVVVACEKDLPLEVPAAELFRALAQPSSSPLLEFKASTLSQFTNYSFKKAGFGPSVVVASALLLAYLPLNTVVGDGLADYAPGFRDAVLEDLNRPEELFPLCSVYSSEADRSDVTPLLDLVGGETPELPPTEREKCTRAQDNGLVIAGLFGHMLCFAFRPAKVRGDSIALLKPFLEKAYVSSSAVLPALLWLRSDECKAVVDSLVDKSLPTGSSLANPLVTVPKLVKKVASKWKLSEEAAALYLQLLALAEPTAKAVQRWNGWNPGTYKDAASELMAKKLVLEAKRERAGRDIFLPGEWVKGVGKNLPTEGWKLALYRHPAGDFARRIPLIPLARLFERAWERVTSGDEPKFEEV